MLLARFDFRDRGGPVVWTAPGGGLDPGESQLECLRRELAEEVVSYDGSDVFSPRAFGVHLEALLRHGVPEAPLDLAVRRVAARVRAGRG